MNCTIPSLNVKVLARAVQSLAKLGDELFIEAKETHLSFITFNQIKNVCAQFHMLENFFTIYSIQTEDNSKVTCKIHMKTLLPLFKGTHIEKKLESLQIHYEPPSDMLNFKVTYKTDEIIMSHTFCLMDPEPILVENFTKSHSNSISGDSLFFSSFLNLFNNSDDITLEITKTKTVARNYSEGAPRRIKSVRSQVSLNYSEFRFYNISEETSMNFSLKPLKSAVLFAETFNLIVGLNFNKGGSPLSITMKNPTFDILINVATINPYDDCSSTISSNFALATLPSKQNQDNSRSTGNKETGDKTVVSKNKSSVSNCKANENIENGLNSKIFTLREQNYEFLEKNPESPRAKKAKYIFKRSFDRTFNLAAARNILLPDSDSED